MKKLIVSAVIVLLGSSAAARAQDRNVVTITLQPEIVLDDAVIYLDQIAKLSGGSLGLRQRMARLDVAEFKLGALRTAVSADQVRFRLMFAGIPATQFEIAGAKRTAVSESDEPITARKIRTFAEQALLAKNPAGGTSREIIAPLLDVRPSDRVQFEATRVSADRVDIAILVNGKSREVVPVAFESAKTVPVNNPGPRLPFAPPPKSEVLIKTRDLVKIVAVIGAAQIVATGEAQQDGRVGEVIRVRNTESNRTVNARVESAGVVTVEY